jgi:hypothetical protein
MCSSSVDDSDWLGVSSYAGSYSDHPVFYGFTEAVFVSQFDVYSRSSGASSSSVQQPGMSSRKGSLTELFANEDILRTSDHRSHTTSQAKKVPYDNVMYDTDNCRKADGYKQSGSLGDDTTSVDFNSHDLSDSPTGSDPIPIARRKRQVVTVPF